VTDIAFHTGVEAPLEYACRLLRKAYRAGAAVAVHGEAGQIDRLDEALWTFEALEFIPHAVLPRDAAAAEKLARTPIVLLRPGASAPAHCRVGVSLAAAPIDGVERYDRAIVIVGADPEEREAGRLRWREFEREGHAVSHVARPE